MSHISANARAPIGTVVGAQSRMDIEGQSSSGRRGDVRGRGGAPGRRGASRGGKGGRAGGGPVGSDYQVSRIRDCGNGEIRRRLWLCGCETVSESRRSVRVLRICGDVAIAVGSLCRFSDQATG